MPAKINAFNSQSQVLKKTIPCVCGWGWTAADMAWKTFLGEAGDTERCKPTFQVLPVMEIENQSQKEVILLE